MVILGTTLVLVPSKRHTPCTYVPSKRQDGASIDHAHWHACILLWWWWHRQFNGHQHAHACIVPRPHYQGGKRTLLWFCWLDSSGHQSDLKHVIFFVLHCLAQYFSRCDMSHHRAVQGHSRHRSSRRLTGNVYSEFASSHKPSAWMWKGLDVQCSDALYWGMAYTNSKISG